MGARWVLGGIGRHRHRLALGGTENARVADETAPPDTHRHCPDAKQRTLNPRVQVHRSARSARLRRPLTQQFSDGQRSCCPAPIVSTGAPHAPPPFAFPWP
jgi:hypothetical protein